MSASAALRGAAETVPIKHEGLERVIRTLVFAVPPVALSWGNVAWAECSLALEAAGQTYIARISLGGERGGGPEVRSCCPPV
jgi:hypothetical protein